MAGCCCSLIQSWIQRNENVLPEWRHSPDGNMKTEMNWFWICILKVSFSIYLTFDFGHNSFWYRPPWCSQRALYEVQFYCLRFSQIRKLSRLVLTWRLKKKARFGAGAEGSVPETDNNGKEKTGTKIQSDHDRLRSVKFSSSFCRRSLAKSRERPMDMTKHSWVETLNTIGSRVLPEGTMSSHKRCNRKCSRLFC